MCFLSESVIPQSLLPGDARTIAWDDAIGMLRAYAFISGREENMYDIHRLV